MDIELWEDSAEGLELLFDVVHMRKVPEIANPDLLIELATVVDKFQCPRAVHAHAEGWMKENIIRRQDPWSTDFAEYLGLALVFGSGEVYRMVGVGLVLSSRGGYRQSKSPRDRLRLHRRVEDTAFGRLVSAETRSELLDTLRDYISEIRECVRIISDVSSQAAESLKPKTAHAKRHSTHAETVLGAYYSNLAHLDFLSTSTRKSPIELLYGLCAISRRVTLNAPAQQETSCSAYDFVSGIEMELHSLVKGILCHLPGPSLKSTGMEQSSQPKRRACDTMASSLASLQVLEIFGGHVGETLLETGDEDSFEYLVGDALEGLMV